MLRWEVRWCFLSPSQGPKRSFLTAWTSKWFPSHSSFGFFTNSCLNYPKNVQMWSGKWVLASKQELRIGELVWVLPEPVTSSLPDIPEQKSSLCKGNRLITSSFSKCCCLVSLAHPATLAFLFRAASRKPGFPCEDSWADGAGCARLWLHSSLPSKTGFSSLFLKPWRDSGRWFPALLDSGLHCHTATFIYILN